MERHDQRTLEIVWRIPPAMILSESMKCKRVSVRQECYSSLQLQNMLNVWWVTNWINWDGDVSAFWLLLECVFLYQVWSQHLKIKFLVFICSNAREKQTNKLVVLDLMRKTSMMASDLRDFFFSRGNFDKRIFAHLCFLLDPVRMRLSVLPSLHCWASSASLVLAAKNYSSSAVPAVHLPCSLFWVQGPFRDQLQLPTLLLSACPSSFQPPWYPLGCVFKPQWMLFLLPAPGVASS